MNITDFYSLDVSFSQTSICVDNESLDWKTILQVYEGDYSGIRLPLELRYKSGKKWTDVLNPTGPHRFVSQKFIDVLIKNGFTGWKRYDISITDKEETIIQGYHGLSILGRAGAPKLELSEQFDKVGAPGGIPMKYLRGLYPDFTLWDGSDFFVPDTTIITVVNKKVRDALLAAKLTNVLFKSLADWEIPKKL